MAATKQSIQSALAKLDHNNDSHWTVDGQPRIETIRMFASDQTLTREAITSANPDFKRNSSAPTPEGAAPPASDPVPSLDKEEKPEQATISKNADELAKVREEIQKYEKEREQGELHRDQTNKAIEDIVKHLDTLYAREIKLTPAEEPQSVIQAYQKSQLEQMQRRAEQSNKLVEAGLNPKLASQMQKAPIDQR